MKNKEINTFNHPFFGKLRTIIIENEPWFIAKDVAEALGYPKASTMNRILDEDERRVHIVYPSVDTTCTGKDKLPTQKVSTNNIHTHIVRGSGPRKLSIINLCFCQFCVQINH